MNSITEIAERIVALCEENKKLIHGMQEDARQMQTILGDKKIGDNDNGKQ